MSNIIHRVLMIYGFFSQLYFLIGFQKRQVSGKRPTGPTQRAFGKRRLQVAACTITGSAARCGDQQKVRRTVSRLLHSQPNFLFVDYENKQWKPSNAMLLAFHVPFNSAADDARSSVQIRENHFPIGTFLSNLLPTLGYLTTAITESNRNRSSPYSSETWAIRTVSLRARPQR